MIANAAAASAGEAQARIRLAGMTDSLDDAPVVTVSDSGGGMDPQTLARAFTPFFSDQPAGRRRGLGLSRARRHVENNGGRIRIDTRPGEGTTVYVQLPPLKQ